MVIQNYAEDAGVADYIVYYHPKRQEQYLLYIQFISSHFAIARKQDGKHESNIENETVEINHHKKTDLTISTSSSIISYHR